MPLPRPVVVGIAVALSAAVGAGVTLSVSHHDDPSVVVRVVEDPPQGAATGDLLPGDPEASTTPDPEEEVPQDAPEDADQKALEAWYPDPRGTVAQISLRFMQSLQRGDDLAALRELAREERIWLSFRDMWTLHRVMSDVRKNARLAGAGPCSRVAQLSNAAAVVACGTQHVVVNAYPWVGLTGVRLSDWTLHNDVFHGPHTHAYTLMEL